MKTILVPIDSNKEGDYVAEEAIRIAAAFDAKVHLVHVTSKEKDKDNRDNEVEYISLDDLSEYEREMDTLNSFKARFTSAGLNCEAHLLNGDPSKQILKLAGDLNVKMIILGYIKHSTWYKTFVGSVSNVVIKESRIPVMLIPAQTKA